MKYNITKQEIDDYEFSYSPSNMGLVSPSYLSGTLVGFQIRHFKGDRRYTLKGDKLAMSRASVRGMLQEGRLVFVEDLVSSIKVSRCVPCAALYGAHVPLELAVGYRQSFKKFYLWLDPDKRKEAVKQCLNLRAKGFDITPIFSDVDPKELTEQQIQEKLT